MLENRDKGAVLRGRIRKYRKLYFLASTLLIFVTATDIATGAGPGVSLRVIDSKLDDKAERGKLWLKAKPGDASFKILAVTNSTGTRPSVSMKIVSALADETGKLTEEKDSDIDLNEIISFSPRSFSLAPREIRQVVITLRPKQDSKQDFWDALVMVTSRSVSQSKQSEGIVSLPILFEVKYPAKIGIGNFDQLSYIFSIENIKPSTSSTFEKFLSVSLKNQGNIPMIFMGQVKLVNSSFSNVSFGPYPFRSKTTNPNSEKKVGILLPRDLPEGLYEILVEANNGKRSIQTIREVSLVFEKPTSLSEKILLSVVFIFALLILMLAIRYLYGGRNSPFSVGLRLYRRNSSKKDAIKLENEQTNSRTLEELFTAMAVNEDTQKDTNLFDFNGRKKPTKRQVRTNSPNESKKSKAVKTKKKSARKS